MGADTDGGAAPTLTRCPSPACRRCFEAQGAPGTTCACPACGHPLTIKPAAVWDVLEQRERAHRAADAARLARLDEPLGRGPGSPRLRERLFHRSADPRWPAARYDLRYEAGVDRPAPRQPPAPGLVVVLDDLRSQWNAGSILRSAEALGWGGVWLCGTTPLPTAPGVARASLGAEQHLTWTYRAEVVAALEQLAASGHQLVALEQTDDAVDLGAFRLPRRLALVAGNEVGGVSAEALARCRQRVSIPLAGRKASLNVAVAFGVAAAGLRAAWSERASASTRDAEDAS